MEGYIFDPVLLGADQERNAYVVQAAVTTHQQWGPAAELPLHDHHSGLLVPEHVPPPRLLPPSIPSLRDYDNSTLNAMLLPSSADTTPTSIARPRRPFDTLAAVVASRADECERKLGSFRELVRDVKSYEDVLAWALDYADSCKVRERERLKSEKCYARLSPDQKRKESSRIEARVHKVKREKLEKAHVIAIKYLVDLLRAKRNQATTRKVKKVINAVLLLQRWRLPCIATRCV